MLKLKPQQYISLFKVENQNSIVIYAVCVEVIAPGEYRLSEPRIVKVTPKHQTQRALPGAVISPFTLGGLIQTAADARKPRASSFFKSYPLKDSGHLTWYKANAPNIFA